jgi:[FeFe] hydrogenase H-cluster maturation GTPase HydF
MELLPLGPVMLIDTPGLDDEGALGRMRVQKALEVLGKTDVAILVTDCRVPLGPVEQQLVEEFGKRQVPYLVVRNKSDLLETVPEPENDQELYVSAATGAGVYALKERIAALKPVESETLRIVGDLLEPLDTVVLVVPIDKAAPKGRLILPQQQTIRDILEAGAISVVVRETELRETLKKLEAKPKLVVTDSQVFSLVAQETPKDVLLTSFSILMARYKGNLPTLVSGVRAMELLQDGDKVLISEGCTHHRQCNDIGTVKIPRALERYAGKHLEYCFTSGREFPEDLSPYRLIVHCGGCMLNEKEMKNRLHRAMLQGVPMTNYGVLLAQVNGILARSLEPFGDI